MKRHLLLFILLLTLGLGQSWGQFSGGSGTSSSPYLISFAADYDLYVAGTQVTFNNAHDVLGDGTVIFNGLSNLLILDGANISCQNMQGILNEMEELTIRLYGNNTVSSSFAGIQSNGKLTFEGTGTLTVTGQDGIQANRDLTIHKGCTVHVVGTGGTSFAGIKGTESYVLNLSDCEVTAVSAMNSLGSVYGFGTMNLNNVALTSPLRAAWSDENHRVEYINGNVVTSQVVFSPTPYNLWVKGVQVTAANASDVFVDAAPSGFALENGSVSYDVSNNVLTLNNAQIVSEGDEFGIQTSIDGLTIKLLGENEISGGYYGLEITDASVTIEGPGKLYVNADHHGMCGYSESSVKTYSFVNGCEVFFVGGSCGFVFTSVDLVVDHAYLQVKGRDYSVLCASLTMNGTQIAAPVGAYFLNDGIVDSDGNYVHDEDVIIAPIQYDLYVAGNQVNSFNASDVLGDGTVKYDELSNTLTLTDANIVNMSEGQDGIKISINNMTIKLLGENRINAASSGINMTGASITIEGPGKLFLANASSGIYAYNSAGRTLTIANGCEVVMSGSFSGINFAAGDLVVNRAKLSAFGGTYSVLCGSLTMTETQITEPEGAHLVGSIMCYSGGNQPVNNEYVTISPIQYNLALADNVWVNSANASDIFGDGTASYDVANNVLTLNGAHIESSAYAMLNRINGLTIHLEGHNSINNDLSSYDSYGIYSEASLAIEGPGTLEVYGKAAIFVSGEGCKLTIMDSCIVEAHGTSDIYAAIYSDVTASMSVSYSALYAYNEDLSEYRSPIFGFTSLTMTDVDFIYPEGASYSELYHRVLDGAGNFVTRQVCISAGEYDLFVGDRRVNFITAPDILGDGTMNFNAETNVLTLNGVSPNSNSRISSSIPGLKIQLVGENSILTTSNGILSSDLIIEGPGTLNVEVISNIGIWVDENLTINNCTLNVLVHGTSFSAIYSEHGTLTISNAMVTVSSGDEYDGPISGFSELNLNNVSITSPEGAVWSDENHRVEDANGDAVTSQVVFSPNPYNLWVKGQQVDVFNASDILGDGTVSYDAASNTLTLNRADIVYGWGNSVGELDGIHSSIDGLTIKLLGVNYIGAKDEGIQINNANTTIAGPGYLNVSGNNGICSLQCLGKTLSVIDGAKIEVRGDAVGVSFADGTLSVERAEMTVQASECDILCAALELNETEMVYPVGAHLYENAIVDSNGNVVKGIPVMIRPSLYHLYVEGVSVNIGNASDILGDGTVSYDASSNILTLNNAHINMGRNEGDGISKAYDELTIRLLGENTIEAYDSGIEITQASVNITGPGMLTIDADYGIWADLQAEDESTLSFTNGCLVVANGVEQGVSCEFGSLIVDGAELRAKGEDYESVVCYSLTLNGAELTSPVGATLDQEHQCIAYAGTDDAVIGEYVIIEPLPYDLYLGDIRVSTRNASDILGDGTASYDASNNILTLNNVNLLALGDNEDGISSSIDNLTIKLIGDNYIEAGQYGIKAMNANTTIEGPGSLIIDCNGTGINVTSTGKTFSITDGCLVVLNAGTNGVWAPYGILNVDGAELRAQGTWISVNCGSLNMNNTQIIAPEGAYYSGTYVWKHDEQDNEIQVSGEYVVIAPIKYDLWVADVQVTSLNADHITGEGITGNVYYDSSNNELYLENASISGDFSYGIETDMDGLFIYLSGENSIQNGTFWGDGIRIGSDFTVITSLDNGSLSIEADYGIFNQSGTTLSVIDCSIDILADNAGVNLSNGGTLSVSNSIMKVTGTSDFSIRVSNLSLSEVDIISPEGAYWNQDNGYVMDDQNQIIKSQVVIGPEPLQLWVAQKQVIGTGNVTGEGISGTAYYDAATNTLTLDNATITSINDNGILSYVDDLTINLVGENTIETEYRGLELNAATTISSMGMGDDVLNINAAFGIYGDSYLTITGNCQVNANGTLRGVAVQQSGGLIINGATLRASGSAASVQTYDLQLTDVEIASPEGAHWNYEAIYDAQDELLTDQVVIAPYNVFNGMYSSDWNEPENWSNHVVPNANNTISIDANCSVNEDAKAKSITIADGMTVEVLSGQTLTAQTIVDSDASQLVINEGAEVVCHSAETYATLSKTIEAWGDNTGWNLIAAPIADAYIETNTTLADKGDYDLYRYDETNHNEDEWVNYKAVPFESLNAGQGYLFANDMDNWHYFRGELNAATVSVDLTYTPENGYPLSGFNLIGNPFAHTIYKGSRCAIDNGYLEEGFYVLGSNGVWLARTDNAPIAPFQAILVRTDNTNLTLNIANTTAAPSNAKGEARRLKLTVEGNRLTDQVFITEGEGRSLKKIAHVNPNAPTLYVKDGEKDCAIAFTNGEKSLTLCFKAKAAGSYTLRLDETTIGKGIVRLTDTMTGETVKLHAGETYTFSAAPGDKAERFTVMMK